MTIKGISAMIAFIALILFVIWFDNQWEVAPSDVKAPIGKN